MKVFIAGMGVFTASGENCSGNLSALLEKRHGIHASSRDIDTLMGDFPIAKIAYTNNELAAKAGVSTSWPRTALLGVIAAQEATASSGLDFTKYRAGFISGTTVGGMDSTENFFYSYSKNKTAGHISQIINHECGKISHLIAENIQAKDFVTTLNTACSSAANAIAFATRMIKTGRLDIAVAGGTDALTAFTLNGFNTLLLLDDELCRPFDARRKGLNLGEGAGYLVLVSEEIARQNNCPVMAEVSGYANASDSFHQTTLSDEGNGPYLAMESAIKMAGLSAYDVGYINLHGTATPNNDLSEGNAILRLFTDKIPAVSSTKSYTGHTLGASGGIEAVYSVLALFNQTTLPNLRFEISMPGTELIPETEARKIELRHVLSNSFGFGGNCCSLLFSKV
ncbi:MAG: beta-ketoacyl-[acyl-carrier-protein] synthase family protein [Bacteroidales bacterium]|nr:beta-ketoacyl-[acyl-carrier-protein] synthase family protein [Bacteroidales bacterium]